MSSTHVHPTIERDGWRLESAEERCAAHDGSFEIPTRASRESLSPGDAAKLLFEIETRERGKVIDRGVDRMWVIVKARADRGYVGVIDNDPGVAENLRLRRGDLIHFGFEHIAEIGKPPRAYVIEKFGPSFFEE